MSTQIIDKLYAKFHENKLAHAYLIETNKIDNTMSELLKLIKKINCPIEFQEKCQQCNFCNLIDKDFFPNLVIIQPDGQFIKKEQVYYLQEKFSLKPVFSTYNIYIILEAEKLNSSSGNSLLKFLEEPNDNTFGFLITNNKNKVLQTITSRCQNLTSFYQEELQKENNIGQKLLEYIKKEDTTIILEIKNYREILEDKTKISQILKQLLEYYLLELSTDSKDLKVNSKCQRKVKIIKKYLEKINYNVNIELLVEAFILEMSDNYEIL